jgi:hypothetical protein
MRSSAAHVDVGSRPRSRDPEDLFAGGLRDSPRTLQANVEQIE